MKKVLGVDNILGIMLEVIDTESTNIWYLNLRNLHPIEEIDI